MTCRELIEFIAEYLTNDLPDSERQAFEAHLAACGACRAYLDSYGRTLALEKSAFEDPQQAAERMPAALVDAILSARKSRNRNEADARNDERPGRTQG